MGKAANTSTRTQAGAPNSPGSHCIFTTIRSSSTAEQTLPASPNNVFDKKPVPSSQPACPCSAHPLLTSPELPHTSPPVLGPGRLVCMEHNNRAAKGGPREDIRRAEDRICSLDPLPGSIHQQIWKTQQWPQDWKRSVFIPIPISRFSRVRLCATPQTAAHQAPPSLGFSRQEHWSGLPLPSPMHESEK